MPAAPRRRLAELLLLPAIAVLDRLDFARKFLLVALLVVAPVGTLVWLQASAASVRIENTRRARVGAAFLEGTGELLSALHRHRVHAPLARVAPAALPSPLPVKAALDRIDALPAEARGLAEQIEGWPALRERLEQVDALPPGAAREAALASAAHDLRLRLTARLGNASRLTLIPEPGSYWLADALLVELPALSETLADAGAAALSAPDSAGAAVQRAAELVAARSLAGKATAHLADLPARLSSPSLEADVREAVAGATAATRAWQEALEAALREPAGSPGPPAEQLARQCLTAIDALEALAHNLVPKLDTVIAARERTFRRQRRLGLAASGAATLLLGYLLAGIYVSVRRAVRALEEAADAEPGTPERFVAPGQDELGQIAAAYSRVRGEQRLLREELRRADRLASIGQLAAGTAHELNEPIAAVLGFAQLAQKTPGLPAPAARDLGKIAQAALHAREIIRQLLLFARQTPPQKAPVDFNQAVREALELVEPRRAAAGVRLASSLAEGLPPIEADAAQLRQVVINLAVNALQASERGGEVEVATGSRDGRLLLSVVDHGAGMSEEVRHHLFLPFYTTKDIGQGTGLGLSVVHGVVTAHGGTIEVTSAPGQGTRIEVRLPLSLSAAPP